MLTDAAVPGVAERVALVTGGGRGIGKAIAEALSAAGARVAIHYNRAEREAKEAADRLEGARAFQADLSDEVAPSRITAAVTEDLGDIDILVNNAGVMRRATTESTTQLDWAQTLQVNLTVPFLLVQEVLPRMRVRGRGAVVNVASIAGLNGGNMGPAYAASKGGLISLTKYLARDCVRYGVRVNAVAPTLTDTDLIRGPELAELKERLVQSNPMGRLAQPSEVASAVLFLASDWASFVNGACLTVAGGP